MSTRGVEVTGGDVRPDDIEVAGVVIGWHSAAIRGALTSEAVAAFAMDIAKFIAAARRDGYRDGYEHGREDRT